MKNNKIKRSYRFSPLIVKEMQEKLKILKITETNFIEVAIIEKLARMKDEKL